MFHYDGEADRRPRFVAAVRDWNVGPGYAVDDAVGLRFTDEALMGAVSPRPDGRAFRVDPGENMLSLCG